METMDYVRTPLNDTNMFGTYIANIDSYLPLHLTVFTHQEYAVTFGQILTQILDIIKDVSKSQTINVCMNMYHHMIQKQDHIFQAVHDHLMSVFDSSDSQSVFDRKVMEELSQLFMTGTAKTTSKTEPLEVQDMEVVEIIESMQLEFVEMESQNFVATTTFQPTNEIPQPYEPIHIEQVDNNIHVVVDGLNFFASLLSTTTKDQNQEKMGYMTVDRSVQKHQFECHVEMKRTIETMIKFFDMAVPFGSHIHVVVKRFGSKKIWSAFKTLFASMLMSDSSTNHIYQLFIAKCEDRADGEADDRLTMRLAVELSKSQNRVFIVSNDNYRSMAQHWNLPCHYKKITDDSPAFGKRTIHNLEADESYEDCQEVGDISTIKFKFSIETMRTGLDLAEIQMEQWICEGIYGY
ncbi:hypothetical protein [Megavirus chiliensis]|uniref:Uncharacterized protein n=2 Tax=Megamimivirinae TaxID=3044648 RepID=A0A2L2DLI4_MIMIV|nr:hypothetical protein MegaChil _gp0167 [Megavirus chiliensis]AEQ32434.1 hypothetical protein [Megavirus chiliensis]AVG47004.1 hypothetical protein [Acanthamoeba polyphaga mimivirus]